MSLYLATAGSCAEQKANAIDTSYTLSQLSFNADTDSGTEVVVELMISQDTNNPNQMFITTEPGSGEKIKGYSFNNSLPNFSNLNSELSFNNQSPRGNCFGKIGEYLYVTGQASPYVKRKELAVPYDITNVLATTTNSTFLGATQGIEIKDDGSVLFVATSNNAEVKICNLSSNFDITSFSSTSTVSLAVADNDGDTIGGLTCIRFKPDGTKVFVSYYVNNTPKLAEFSLSSAWDLSTKTFVSSINIGSQLGLRSSGGSNVNAMIAGFDWNTDGSRLYAVSIHQDINTGQVKTIEYV